MKVKLKDVKANPNNPRVIKDDQFKKLVKSIEEFPEMLSVRKLVCTPDMVVLGGNMRLRALQSLGVKEVEVEIVDWDEQKQKEFIIKDNVSFGEWNHEQLANEWDAIELQDWGLELPVNVDDMSNNTDYTGFDVASKLERFMEAELKRIFLVYESETFENVVQWFNDKQEKFGTENHSQVILKLMENGNI